MLEPQEEHRPDLRVDFLQEEAEARLRDADAAVVALGVDEGADLEELAHVGGWVSGAEEGGVAAAVYDVVEDSFPLCGGVLVEELDGDIGVVGVA